MHGSGAVHCETRRKNAVTIATGYRTNSQLIQFELDTSGDRILFRGHPVTTGDGRANALVRGGIPDALQGGGMMGGSMGYRGGGYSPQATAAIDTTGDGRANALVRGVDRNGDGIPDALQGGGTMGDWSRWQPRSNASDAEKLDMQTPACKNKIHELECVGKLLEKIALLLGLDKSDARFLQLQFEAELPLDHKLQVKNAGLSSKSEFEVLKVDEVLKAREMDIVAAASENQVADVCLVCDYAPKNVSDKKVLLLIHIITLILL